MTSSRNCFRQRRDNAVAEAEATTPETMTPPLYDVVDPDALDALFDSRSAATGTTPGYVRFNYCEYEVTVTDDGLVTLERAETPS